MLTARRSLLLLALGLIVSFPFVEAAADAKPLELLGRTRVKDKAGNWTVQLKPLRWNPKETAVIICDMWDDHYCQNAARRVAEMAPVMNQVVNACRERGMLIIHCPSGCMDRYKETPQRKLARQAPAVNTKTPLKNWCYLDPKHEAPLLIDISEPCDDEKPREKKRFYTKQIDTLEIKPGDAITDSAEAYYLMKQRGIKNVILMGVHTNMCVLGRPFGIRQLVYQGMNVALMRDMTDAMYNPALAPKVSHCRGTELVIEHIERHWCPTIASTEITGKPAFRFAEDKRRHVVFVVGGNEYNANESMPQFAHLLRDKQQLSCEVLLGRGRGQDYRVPGLEALKKADLLVLFLRRRALPKDQLALIRSYLDAGKPLVALRTTSHGFDVKDPPPVTAVWADFDKEVLGCDYTGYGNKDAPIAVVKENVSHPILEGINPKLWKGNGETYNIAPVAKDATVLLVAKVGNKSKPQALVRTYKGGKIFYTALGHKEDFQEPAFVGMLINACKWGLAD